MARIVTKEILNKRLNILAIETSKPLMIESGSAYTTWKVTTCPRGSRTLFSANTKRELYDLINAAIAAVELSKEGN